MENFNNMTVKLNKILIAGRGEIALRIIRTAKSMGLATTGIYSESDKDAAWIRQSDESWPLGSGPLSETYLNTEKIVSIAVKAGAGGIHPGYGFLSENWQFAALCDRHNIRFIGPSAEILKLMGDKPVAHNHVRNLGFPVPERYSGSYQKLAELKDSLVYPVIVKAAAGGGGKGMRKVTHASRLEDSLRIASVEALQYFGNNEVYIEQFLNDVRHVEIQILGDKKGNLVHLYERECSVQRRHQKLIEESPAPITNILRQKLIEAAMEIARSVNYYGAGTVEFLVRDDQFWFLEMNPRIQVEHGVTEMVTGIDIVRQQILIANDMALEFGQNEVKHSGHSIEARIYAEDPENGLLPSPGTIRRFIIPGISGVRVDTGAADNTPVLADFDPLIAKLIVHASDRANAIEKMNEVINKTVITGIRHNLSLLQSIFGDDAFLRNAVSTSYLESNLNNLTEVITTKKQSESDIASVAAAILLLNSKSSGTGISPWQKGFWRNVRQIRLRNNNEIIGFEYEHKTDKNIDFQQGDNAWNIRDIDIVNQQLTFTENSRKFCFYVYDDATDGIEVSDGRLSFLFGRFSDNINATYENEEEIFSHSSDMITAPQPGTIMDIKVSEGQQVKRGDYLLTIESMKLENTIMAVKHGYIKRIAIKAGDKVKKNEPLIYLQDNINN